MAEEEDESIVQMTTTGPFVFGLPKMWEARGCEILLDRDEIELLYKAKR